MNLIKITIKELKNAAVKRKGIKTNLLTVKDFLAELHNSLLGK